MTRPKGGRGKVAPYESTHLRVPIPIKEKLQKQIDEYKALVIDGEQPEQDSHDVITLDEAKVIACEILKQKKSARQSVTKLLTALYGVEVTQEELK